VGGFLGLLRWDFVDGFKEIVGELLDFLMEFLSGSDWKDSENSVCST
jgi:hypothetical protein